jgi:hypothetical protein
LVNKGNSTNQGTAPPPKKKTPEPDLPLQSQVVLECVSMAKYAFASGKNVPGEAIEKLEKYIQAWYGKTPAQGASPVNQPTKADIKQLIEVHNRLSKIVEPAKPRTILLLEREKRKHNFFNFIGAVPFIRRMALASFISLVLFIIISLSPDINNKPETWDLFRSSGVKLLLRECFLLCAAGLGASFNALFKANRYIVRGTFDPTYESSYWIRFLLGIIAGMIMATLIPIEESSQADFGKPLLAMLGGFSADFVYRIIERLIESLNTLVQGNSSEVADARAREQKARLMEDQIQGRQKMNAHLVKLQQDMDNDTSPGEIKKKIANIMNQVNEEDFSGNDR